MPDRGADAEREALSRLLTAEQMEECLSAQRVASAAGMFMSLREVAARKGFLPEAEALPKSKPRADGAALPEVPGFELAERIGRGSMGSVYRARQTALGRTVALKLLHRRYARSRRFVARFLREARLAARLDHPNAVRVYLAGQAGPRCYLAMEYVEGATLAETLRGGRPLEERRAMAIAAQIASALAQAHRAGILHRDIKPANILLSPDGTAKLADLGLAKDLNGGEAPDRPGTTVGTAAYMAPEQCRAGGRPDARSDLYSLGATLYHMLTGSPPFPGEDRRDVMKRHIFEEPVPVRERNPNVSLAAAAVVHRLLAKDPEERYASAEDLLLDLAQYEREASGIEQAAVAGAQRRRRLRWMRVAAWSLGLIVLALALRLYGPLKPTPHDLLARAERLEAEGRPAEALRRYGDLQRRHPHSPEGQEAARRMARLWQTTRAAELLEEARALYDAERWEAARDAAQRVRRDFPGAPAASAAAELALAAARDGLAAEAASARAHLAAGDWDAARRAAEAALRLDPGSEEAKGLLASASQAFWAAAGEASLAEGRLEEALDAFRRALDARPDADLERRAAALAAEIAGRNLLVSLVPKIDSSPPVEWAWGEADLAEIRPAVSALRAVLADPERAGIRSPHTRPALLAALLRLGDEQAAKALLDILDGATAPIGGPDPAEGRFAALALTALGPEAVPPLAERLKPEAPARAEWCAEALARLGAPAVETLTAAARADDPAFAAMALRALGAAGAPAAAALARFLDDEREGIAAEAARRLAALGPDAVDGIMAAVPDLKAQGWRLALEALVQAGPPAVGRLVASRASLGGKEKVLAAQAVGRIGEAAIPALVESARGADPAVRDAALEMLRGMGGRVADRLLALAEQKDPFPDEIALALRALDDRAVPALAEGFVSPNPARRDAAVKALAAIGPRGRAVLGDIAQDARRPIEDRLRAVDVLASTGPEAASALLALIGEEGGPVAARAEQAVRSWPRREGSIALRAALQDPSARVRLQALRLYWELVGRDGLGDVVSMLGDRADSVRGLAVSLIGNFGDARQAESLLPLLRDRSAEVRTAAVSALARIGGPLAVHAFIQALDDRTPIPKEDLKTALAGFGRAALPQIYEAFNGAKYGAKADLLDVVARIGGAEAVDFLVAALDDRDAALRERCATLLGGLGGYRAVNALLQKIEDTSPTVRRAVVESLGLLGDRRAVSAVADRLLYDSTVAVRLAAVGALAKLGGPDARNALAVASQQDTNEAVRRAALLALNKF